MDSWVGGVRVAAAVARKKRINAGTGHYTSFDRLKSLSWAVDLCKVGGGGAGGCCVFVVGSS